MIVYLPKGYRKDMDGEKTSLRSPMESDACSQDIESSVMALGAVFAAMLLGAIIMAIT